MGTSVVLFLTFENVGVILCNITCFLLLFLFFFVFVVCVFFCFLVFLVFLIYIVILFYVMLALFQQTRKQDLTNNKAKRHERKQERKQRRERQRQRVKRGVKQTRNEQNCPFSGDKRVLVRSQIKDKKQQGHLT